jgi:hypothetical protein
MDIVKKLRDFEKFLRDPKPGEHTIKSDIFDEAADEIERLRERVAVLDATLEGALDSCKIWERILTKALGEKE